MKHVFQQQYWKHPADLCQSIWPRLYPCYSCLYLPALAVRKQCLLCVVVVFRPELNFLPAQHSLAILLSVALSETSRHWDWAQVNYRIKGLCFRPGVFSSYASGLRGMMKNCGGGEQICLIVLKEADTHRRKCSYVRHSELGTAVGKWGMNTGQRIAHS